MFKKKIITYLLTISLSAGGGMYLSHKFSESNNDSSDFVNEQLETEESYTEIILDSLKTEFNENTRFEVMRGELEVNHTSKYTENSIDYTNSYTGKKESFFKPTITKSGSAIAVFDFDIESLSECDINVDKVDVGGAYKYVVDIAVPYPVLDESSVHRKKDSFKLDESKTSINFDAKLQLIGQAIYTKKKETMDARATRKLEDEIDENSSSKIKEAYSTNTEKIKELEDATIESVYRLTNGLVGNVLKSIDTTNEFEINVKMKGSKLANM